MKMTKHAIYVAIAFCLAAVALLSDAYALEKIIRPYQSVRSSGMGGVRLTTGLYDENFFGNAARVTKNPTFRFTLLDPMIEVNSGTFKTIDSVSQGSGDNAISKIADTAGNNNHGRIQTTMPAVYIPTGPEGKWAFAIAMMTSTQFDVALRRSYQLNPQAISDVGPAFTVGTTSILDDGSLSVGGTVHAMYRVSSAQGYSFIDYAKGVSPSPSESGGEGGHIDLDLGATYLLPYKPIEDVDLTAGLAINNLLGGRYSQFDFNILKQTDNRPTPQPRTLGFGVAAHKATLGPFDDTLLAVELTDIGNNPDGSVFKTVHIGTEGHWSILTPRLGINQGYFTAGLGLDLRFVNLDVSTYGEEASTNVGGNEDRMYSFKLAFQI